MSLVLIVWLVTTVIPALKALFVFLCVTLFIVGTFLGLFWLIEGKSEGFLKFTSYKKYMAAIVLLMCILPGKEATWYMVGAYGTQKLIENPSAQEIASDGVDVLKALMKKAKDSLADSKKESE